ncbi:Dapper-like protein 2 [Heterocephalus glaber]|uniref:Dapper-like protein 2 n=1 Tax=Heterocephalus glaber TaxID=10181 RepID=G5BM66_HETGA|nr:Dapper-like protein 2 [Heterocephalus glaber]
MASAPSLLSSSFTSSSSHDQGESLEFGVVLYGQFCFSFLPPQSWLRQQDAGLKTHLDQLDLQISELQLGMCRASNEGPDSDSRPSSGFYELSDAGSCSLSTSCASVCSDWLSPSLSSLLPASHPSKSRSGVGNCRPRSADENTVPAWRPQPAKEGSSFLDSAAGTGRAQDVFRPRPVSTGDLERVLPVDVGLQSLGADATPTSLLCQGTDPPAHVLDPTYQHDLVSRGGREVYPYPSPLHAVALQSPLFTLAKETPWPHSHSPPRDQSTALAVPVCEEGRAGAYIDRLLRLRALGPSPRDVLGEQGPLRNEASPFPQKAGDQKQGSGGQPEKLVCARGRRNTGVMAQSLAVQGDGLRQQGPTPLRDTPAPSTPPEEGPRPSNPRNLGETAVGLAPCPQAWQLHNNCSLATPRRLGCERPLQALGCSVHLPRAAEAPMSRLRTAPAKTRAVKIRRRASDEVPGSGRQPLPHPESPQGVHGGPWLPPERGLWHRPQGRGPQKRPSLAGEAPGRSCSESTLYPIPFLIPLVVAQQHSCQASASSRALFPAEATPLSAAARRKQRPWKSSVEISGKLGSASCADPPTHTVRKAEDPPARDRPLLARQEAEIESDLSEHSAECTSLFHSTIAETSEEEASDHTTNRFGDQESSSSDSEGGIQGKGSSLELDQVVAGRREQPPQAPAGSRPTLPPVPKLCRIKASRALKKKIRRFQPAALKVMTMV